MKSILLLSITMLFISNVRSQSPVIRLYAYSRVTNSGVPDFNNKNQNTESSNLPKDYFIYAEIKKGTGINISTAFIDGKYYNVTIKKIKTPVIKDQYEGVMNSNKKYILVKKSNNDMFEIKRNDQINDLSLLSKAEKMRKENSLMLIAKYKATILYPVLKNITVLQPVQGM